VDGAGARWVSLSAGLAAESAVLSSASFFKPANPIALFEHDEVNVIMQRYNFLIALPRAEAYLHWPIAGLVRFRRARNRLDKVVQRMISHHRAVEWTGATCFPCCWLRAMRNPTTPV
jgi:hypothetical protein